MRKIEDIYAIKEFLNYWNEVIRNWFNDIIDDNQNLFLNKEWLKLSRQDMPEPYWGNPNECSIVIANYNPGGGGDGNCNTDKKCADCQHTFIGQVKQKGYYAVVESFPIIKKTEANDSSMKTDEVKWWESYGGSKWWQNKKKWLDENIIDIRQESTDQSNKKPFALEFCGWHSERWPSNACLRLNRETNMANVIDDCFLKPLAWAVHCSTAHLGVCVGSQFFHLFNMIKKNCNDIERVDIEKYNAKSPFHLHLFKIYNEYILVLWGQKWNRYPQNIKSEIKKLLSKCFSEK